MNILRVNARDLKSLVNDSECKNGQFLVFGKSFLIPIKLVRFYSEKVFTVFSEGKTFVIDETKNPRFSEQREEALNCFSVLCFFHFIPSSILFT